MAEGTDRAERAALEAMARQARALMASLGAAHLGQPLGDLGWRFGFDRARRRLGACHWRPGPQPVRRLTLSKHFALKLGWEEMEDVVRHEIAHALDYETRGQSDHGPRWKAWARRCGADPTRLYEGPAARLDPATAPYVGHCPACDRAYPYFRRLKRRRACAACCDRHSGGRFDPRFELDIRRND